MRHQLSGLRPLQIGDCRLYTYTLTSQLNHDFLRYNLQSAIANLQCFMPYTKKRLVQFLKLNQSLKSREDRIRTCDPLVPNQVRYRPALLPDYVLRFAVREGFEPSVQFNPYGSLANY